MKHKKGNHIIFVLLIFLTTAMLFSSAVNADTGPKESVRIIFENMGDELCYGTLLSKTESTGPSSVWNGDENYAIHNENERFSYSNLDYKTWKAFVEYEDPDGYYFLQEGWAVNGTKKLEWTYYPPKSFKILLYYPETEQFLVSGICERYAFDTYYTVDMEGCTVNTGGETIGSVEYDENLSTDERIEAYRSYDYIKEFISFIARVIITVLIETAVALLFGFRSKKQLQLLIVVNIVTQIILNVFLNIINYKSGQIAFVLSYIFIEIVVFILEATVYCILMKKLSESHKKNIFYVLYALIANGISFGTGMLIAEWLPGIF